jgi:perosamine synthetase
LIHIASPNLGTEEFDAVREVMNSGMVAQGPKVAELEQAFADYCGTTYAAAVSSGTAAIHAALHAAGVEPGDEVITTPFSFIATVNPILFVGAKPVLVDIDPQTFNINAAQLEKAITPRTKAIMPVHLYGQPCDADVLKAIADAHGLVIIEDACQAVGAEYGGKKTGILGDLGCFSLYATKNIMSGEGGMVTTNSKKYLESIKQFRQHGMSSQYEYVGVGYNYRMTDLQAAIAVEQLKKADTFTAARQRNAKLLNKGLAKVRYIELPRVGANRTHVYHQYTIRLDEDFAMGRDEFIAALKTRGVGAGAYYHKALHAYPHIAKLGYKTGDFPHAEAAAKCVVSLPVHPKVSEQDIQIIVDAISELANG